MDGKRFIDLGLLTPDERRAWDVAIAIAKEAEARYGIRLHISILVDPPLGYKLSAVDLGNMMEWTQLMSVEFLEDAEATDPLMIDRFLRQLAEWRDKRRQPAASDKQ